MAKVLIVDDEESMLEVLGEMLEREGYEVVRASSGETALQAFSADAIDLIITDVQMKPLDGVALLREAKKADPDVTVIMMTAFATVENAVEAMKEGAYEYVMKPFKRQEILLKVRRALDRKRIESENRQLRQEVQGRYHYENIIGVSTPMQTLFRLIEKVSPTDSTVLIYGESGTGKELVAKALHYNSSRRERAFEAINCAALPEPLLESELFGHVKGSFTGAYSNKTGLLEVANKGTVFLDEIGSMGTAMQAKMLRVLQEREIKRVGDTATRKIDVRIIAATNERLSEKVVQGTFREDLFFRLSVIPIEIPPLRDRREDIPLLARHYLQRYNTKSGRSVGLSDAAMRVLEGYAWPGNVRELENVIEHAATLCDSKEITPHDFPEMLLSGLASVGANDDRLKSVVHEAERQQIIKVLHHTKGEKKEAATILQISLPSLYRKINDLGIEDL